MISCPCAAAAASSERKPQTSRRKAAEQMAQRAEADRREAEMISRRANELDPTSTSTSRKTSRHGSDQLRAVRR